MVHKSDKGRARSNRHDHAKQSYRKRLEAVFMNFITGLSVSRKYDAIMAVVDKLSYRPKYAATQTNIDVMNGVSLVMLLHGITTIGHRRSPSAITN